MAILLRLYQYNDSSDTKYLEYNIISSMRIRSYADALSDIKANGQWLLKKGRRWVSLFMYYKEENIGEVTDNTENT